VSRLIINLSSKSVKKGAGHLTVLPALLFVMSMVAGQPAVALDVFTLWRQPEIPLAIVEGDWVDYRTQALAGGRQEVSLTRIVCLDRASGSDDESWLLELLPLVEDEGVTKPVPGEGVHLRVSRALLNRKGNFLDAVIASTQWRDGVSHTMTADELRDDPLVAATLASDFRPDQTEQKDATTRIVEGTQFVCEQFVMSAADTQSATLPAGQMIQTTTREIVAAIHPDIPFLGLAYVSERVRAESRLDPPSRRMKAPAPRVTVEVMELVAFGHGAVSVLIATD
jgi:hypothetical protein